MTVNWVSYEPYRPLFEGDPRLMPRREARCEYNRLMGCKEEREDMLISLMCANGVGLTWDDDGVSAFDAWFTTNVELSQEDPSRLAWPWYGVSTDFGLFMGDLLIRRYPWIYWAFFTAGKRDWDYQWPVVMGFRVQNPKYSLEFQRDVSSRGLALTRRRVRESGHFLKILQSAEFSASGEMLLD